MTFRSLVLGGAALIALGATAISVDALAASTQTPTVAAVVARPTVALDKVQRPAATLAKMHVENTAGVSIGTVVDVVTQADGKPIAVTVDASGLFGKRRWIGFQAGTLSLDRGRGVLVTSMTKAEIKALPVML